MGLFSATGNLIAQASDPGATAGPGAIWSDTDANITYRRNDANSAWVQIHPSDSIASGTIVNDDVSASAAIVQSKLVDIVNADVNASAAIEASKLTGVLTTLSNQEDILTADQTTTSTTYVSSNLSITIANRSGGLAICTATCGTSNNTADAGTSIALFDDGVTLTGDINAIDSFASVRVTSSSVCQSIVSLNGSVINLRFKADVQTSSLVFISDDTESKLVVFEIS